MQIHIDTSSREPIYRQIVDQVQSLVARGELAQSRRLPSVRELAVELRVNPNTVARAYRELERQGLVVRQQGRGVFVNWPPPARQDHEWRPLISKLADDLLVRAWTLGVSTDDVIDELRERASRLSKKSGDPDE